MVCSTFSLSIGSGGEQLDAGSVECGRGGVDDALAIHMGGILCVRREVVESSHWSELLTRGLCEDTGLIDPLRQLGELPL